MTRLELELEMANAGALLQRGAITWEEYFAVMGKLTARMARDSNTLRLQAEAELLTGGTVEVGR